MKYKDPYIQTIQYNCISGAYSSMYIEVKKYNLNRGAHDSITSLEGKEFWSGRVPSSEQRHFPFS